MKKTIVRCCKTKDEAQALANFLWNEGCRHGADIAVIIRDLRAIERKWGIKPHRKREFVKP